MFCHYRFLYSLTAIVLRILQSFFCIFIVVFAIGGGVYIGIAHYSVCWDKCHFYDNNAHNFGAGVYLSTVQVAIAENSQFVGNYGLNGAGIYAVVPWWLIDLTISLCIKAPSWIILLKQISVEL